MTLALVPIGCAKKPAAPASAEAPVHPSTPSAPAMASHEAQASAPMAQAAPGLTGTILETMDAAGYTYLRLKTPSGEVWAAVNQTPVKKGDEVTVASAMPMDGFESKTLNRKFDRIYFGTLGLPASATVADASPHGAAGAAAAAPAASTPDQLAVMKQQHEAAAAKVEDVGEIKVAKAEGADGRTVAELYASRAKLKDGFVAVRGKVVKFLPGIMGRNWIHVRDGSGTAAGKDNDLTVTTQAAAAVGDVVLVRGTVRLDKDFGMGYQYTLLLEDATVTK